MAAMRVLTPGLLSLLVLALGAPSAVAEGGFKSHMSGWMIGKESRSWTDNNKDKKKTRIRLRDCKMSYPVEDHEAKNAKPTLGLYKNRQWPIPDEARGQKKFNCFVNGRRKQTRNWGRVGDGDYHFTLKKVNGMTSNELGFFGMDAKKVRVWY